MPLPDTREFTVPVDYLNAWCASQPERPTQDLVADLASYAGFSWSHMRFVLAGDRPMAMSAVPGLMKGLELPEDQAEHFRRMAELQHAPARSSLPLRREVWAAFAEAHGLPWDGVSALLSEVQSAALTEAALAPALAALEDGLTPPKTMVKCAVVPVVHASVSAALPQIEGWKKHRIAPRLIAVPSPGEGAGALLTWQGLLGWAREALVRLPADQREYRTFTAAVDEPAFQALSALCAGFRARLVSLAEDAELLPEERLIGVLIELLPLAGPVVGGDESRVWAWRKPDFDLPPLDPEDPSTSAERDPVLAPGEEPMPTLPGQTHFPTWLKLWRAWRARRGEEHSDGYLARRTGLSRAAIYDLSTGTVHFGSQHVPLFLRALKLEGDRHAPRVLEGMARIAARQHPEHQAKLVAAQRSHGLEHGVRVLTTEAHFARSQWYVQATYILAQLQSFQAVPGWVSRALMGRITWQGAREALITLGQLGLLRGRPDGVVVPVEPKERVEGPHTRLAAFELLDGVLRLLQSEIGFGDASTRVHGHLMALPERAMPRLMRNIDEFGAEVRAVLVAAEERRSAGVPMTRLVQISWQCFQTFRFPIKKKKRRS